ncbi:MAG: acyl-CoA thioesterase-1 [Verrucomicrobiales bacterium]|jgi:acyl-CoA thioesterase-1
MQRRSFLSGFLFCSLFAIPACGQDVRKNGGTKIACVGDSITYGMGIKDRAKNAYPKQLEGMLGDGVQVKNFGISGTTLLKNGDHPYWTTKQYHGAIEWQPEIVVIKLGTNDTKPKNWKHKEQVATDLRAMIAVFRSLPSKPQIFLCLPVPVFPERWGIRDSVIKDELIPIIRDVAKQEDCAIIDLYQALDGKKEFFPDKVHPNKDGATVIAKTVAAALKKDAKALVTKTKEKTQP